MKVMPTPSRSALLAVLSTLSTTPAACSDVCADCGVEPTTLPGLLLAIERTLGIRTVRKNGAVRVHALDWGACQRLCEEWWENEGPGASDVVHGVREAVARLRSRAAVAASN